MMFSSLETKRGTIKWNLILFLPVIFGVVSTVYVSTLADISILKENIPNYRELFDPLAIGIQIILGLIVASSFFYLGKFHDYRKDFLQSESKFLMLIEKRKRQLKQDNEQDRKEFIAIEAKHELFQNIRKTLAGIPKSVIREILIMLGVFSVMLVRVYLMKNDPTEISFILLIINLIARLSQFLISW